MIYKDTYLTFEAISSGTFSFSQNNIQYSIDNGSTWTTLTAGSNTPTISAGNKVMFKANLSSNYGIGQFSSSFFCNFKVYGNPMSLIFGDNFVGQTNLSSYKYNYVFSKLFFNCRYLVDAQFLSLPATALATNCCWNMFSGCTSLTKAPLILPATTLANSCYYMMFYGCTSLTSLPILPATTLASYCYYDMFYGCTSLTTIPSNYLPATTLADNCYNEMFYGCSSLVNVPSNLLPATTLANKCYYAMFKNCISLTTAPDLNAPNLVSQCYHWMFNGCSSLNYVKCLVIDPGDGDTTYTGYWLTDTASSGTFITSAAALSTWKSKRTDGDCGIPDGWSYNKDTYSSSYLTFEAITSGTFSFTTNNIQYSTNNGSTWTTLTAGSNTPTITAGNNIMFKASGLTPDSNYGIGTFSSTGNFNVSGNVMSLYYGDNFINSNQFDLTGNNYALQALFKNCTRLISAENLILPATTLTEYCYYNMFSGCTSLTTAPKILPATTLASECYACMFDTCISLTTTPELPATTLANYCYEYMFSGCWSLTTAPKILPATTLANGCYKGMFRYCSSLTKVPSNYLPAMTLVYQCYYEMFKECTALKKSPILRSPTITTFCYASMFQGCTHLEYIVCLATDPISSDTNYWVYSVASSGIFVQNSSDWSNGNSGIPSGWNSVSYDDDLVYDMVLSIGTDTIYYNTSTTISNGVETLYYGYKDDVTESTTFTTSPTGIVTIT